MKLKIAATALVLTCLPALSMAMGCSERDHQVQSCATGTVWDAASNSCVKQATS